MLQQILEDMYIEPEILAELPEEQKQLLFCKLREEQLRRWRIREEALEQNDCKTNPSETKQKQTKTGQKKVEFLMATDGNPWVWVMGEHSADKSIEQMLEEEAAAKAKKKAEEEAETLRLKEEEEQLRKEKDEEERLMKEQLETEVQLQKEAEARRIAEDQLQSLKTKQQQESERQLKLLQEKHKRCKLVREQSYKDLKARRTSEILAAYISKKGISHDDNSALEDTKQLEKNWQLQEAKAKVMEEKLRTLARLAREEHRTNSVRVKTTRKESWRDGVSPAAHSVTLVNMKALNDVNEPPIGAALPPATPLVRQPPRSNDRAAAEKWFVEREKPKGVGINPANGMVWEWFHGAINRVTAESTLERKPVHSFLIRLSDKIWGYVVSYRAQNSFKHFLVDVTPDGMYQFFGTDQLEHESLASLVQWHASAPISISGQEFLFYPCGQIACPPDYATILPEHVETTCL